MISLHLACNDPDNGNHTGQVDSIQFYGSDNLDPMLMLHGRALRCVPWRSGGGKTRFLRLGHFPAIRMPGYATWVGNWCWDAALISDDDAAKIANYLRKRGWHNEGGWVEMGDKWDSSEPFTGKDFQEVTP